MCHLALRCFVWVLSTGYSPGTPTGNSEGPALYYRAGDCIMPREGVFGRGSEASGCVAATG